MSKIVQVERFEWNKGFIPFAVDAKAVQHIEPAGAFPVDGASCLPEDPKAECSMLTASGERSWIVRGTVEELTAKINEARYPTTNPSKE